jgi:hypothetical protein
VIDERRERDVLTKEGESSKRWRRSEKHGCRAEVEYKISLSMKKEPHPPLVSFGKPSAKEGAEKQRDR